MRRFRHFNDSGSQSGEINISPLIDIVFILLIFFIVTTVFLEETGVEVDKPTAASSQQLEKQSILIAITAEGQIYHAGQQLTLQGLRSVLQRKLRNNEDTPVIIRPDTNGRNGRLVAVMDIASQAGAKKVSLATEKR